MSKSREQDATQGTGGTPNVRLVKNSLWVQAGHITSRIIASLVLLIILRWLTPEEYGVFVLCTVVISFADLIKDFGLQKALIQTREDVEDVADIVFWVNLGAVCLLYLLIILASPWLAEYFKNEALRRALPVMSLVILLSPAFLVHHGLLVRKERFDLISLALIAYSLISYLGALPLSMRGFGYWALIIPRFIGMLVLMLIYWRAEDWRPRFRFETSIAQKVLSFGGWVSVESLVGWIQAQINNILAGRFYGVGDLANYDVGSRYGLMLYSEVSAPLSKSIYPYLCKLADDIRELRRSYLKIQQLLALVLWPMTVYLYFALPEVLSFVLLERWDRAIPIIRLILIAGAGAAFVMPNFELWRSVGRPDIGSKYVLIRALFAIPLYYWIAVNFDIRGLAGAYMALIIVNLPIHSMLVAYVLHMRFQDYIKITYRALAICVVLSIVLSVVYYLLPGEEIVFSLIRLLIGLVITVALIWFFSRSILIDPMRTIFDVLRDSFPYISGLLRLIRRGEL